MRQNSYTKPNTVEIDVIGDLAHVSIFDNIEEIEDGYEYDYYLIKVTYQDDLEDMILEDLGMWIDFAKTNCTNN